MSVLSYSGVRERIRETVRDAYALLGDDDFLDGLIDEAQREYALLSGSLIGEAEIQDNGKGVFECPPDWIEAVRAIGTDGVEIPFYSWKYLNGLYPDFRVLQGGCVKGLVTDFDGFRKLRIFPRQVKGEYIGKIYYKRLSSGGKLEVKNREAVEQYSIYEIFLLAGKNEAITYYNRFLDLVNGESSQVRGIDVKRRIRRGRFF